ncbi:hypothetical protein RZS08_55530, partial [Arthrospira platensis SPKY1]|nr:hypothetical protein [Arthrospira platensis SPKY1]
EQHVGPDIAPARLHLLDLQDVGVGRQLDIVLDAHRRHDEAELARELATQRLDLVGEPPGPLLVDQGEQAVAELEPDRVDLQGRGDRLLGRCRRRRWGGRQPLGLLDL